MKCISLDLDGTLLNTQERISAENMRALHACIEKGYHVIINTGRNYEEILPLDDLDELRVPLLLGNGTEMRDKNRLVIKQVALERAQVKEIAAYLTNKGLRFFASTDKGNYHGPIHNLFKSDVLIYKLIVTHVNQNEVDDYINEIKKFGEINAVYFPSGSDLEIASPLASKGNALLDYLKKNGLSSVNAAAFGDEANDISQFNVAGHKIVMGNARAQIKEYGTFITKSNNEHGVAYALREFLKWI